MPPPTDQPARSAKAARERRAFAVGFGISILVHVAAIILYPAMRRDLPQGTAFRFDSPSSPEQGTRVLRLAPFDERSPAEEPEEPLDRVEPRSPEVPTVQEFPDDLPEADELFLPSVAERLRTRLTVPELWEPLTDRVLALPMGARERLVLHSRIMEWYDSLAQAAAEERALTDWTYTDADGKRWGAADGLIYLGDFAIPVPFGFGVSPSRREELADRMWQWEELQRQGVRVELVESWKERQEAIRSRMDRERAARADTGGVGR